MYYMVISFSWCVWCFLVLNSSPMVWQTCMVNMVFEYGVLVAVSVCMSTSGIMVQLFSLLELMVEILKLV